MGQVPMSILAGMCVGGYGCPLFIAHALCDQGSTQDQSVHSKANTADRCRNSNTKVNWFIELLI